MRNTNSIRLVAAIIIFTAISVNGSFAQNASAITQNREVSGFHEIEIGGVFNVTLIQGTTEGVKITAESEMMKQIITKVENGSLEISIEGKNHYEGKMDLEITFKNVDEIECSGAITLTSAGPLKFSNLELGTSGTAKTELNLTADKLDVNISGTGSTTLKGSAQSVDLDISGSGKYKASELIADKYDVDISGVGNAELTANKLLEVSVSGSGIVKYKGEPQLKQSISGTGKVSRL